MKEVERLSIHEIVRRTGHDRNTVRRALRREGPPQYRRPPRPSKLDPFKDEIHRLLQDDPRIPGKRIRELIEELGFDGGKTILDDHLRELRPLFERKRTYRRRALPPPPGHDRTRLRPHQVQPQDRPLPTPRQSCLPLGMAADYRHSQ